MVNNYAVRFGQQADYGMKGNQQVWPFIYTFVNANSVNWDSIKGLTGLAALADLGPIVAARSLVRHDVILDPDFMFKLLYIQYSVYAYSNTTSNPGGLLSTSKYHWHRAESNIQGPFSTVIAPPYMNFGRAPVQLLAASGNVPPLFPAHGAAAAHDLLAGAQAIAGGPNNLGPFTLLTVNVDYSLNTTDGTIRMLNNTYDNQYITVQNYSFMSGNLWVDPTQPESSVNSRLDRNVRINVQFQPQGRYIYGQENQREQVQNDRDPQPLSIFSLQGYEYGPSYTRTPILLPQNGHLHFDIYNDNVEDVVVAAHIYGMKVRL